MINLNDVGMSSNITHAVNAMNLGEDCEQVSAQQFIDYIRHKSKNIDHEFIFIVRYFQYKRETDSAFFFTSEVDYVSTLRSVFWANGRARFSYLSFFWCDSVWYHIQD